MVAPAKTSDKHLMFSIAAAGGHVKQKHLMFVWCFSGMETGDMDVVCSR
jgi:hypothetical protein